MAVQWADGVANSILNLFILGTVPSAPAGCFARLYTTAAEPTAAGAGSAVEATFSGYAQPNCRTAITTPASGTGRQLTNNAAKLSFGTPAGASAETYRWIGFWSAATGGTYIGYGQLQFDVAPVVGQELAIAVNSLILRQL